jgi:hypothetical protein
MVEVYITFYLRALFTIANFFQQIAARQEYFLFLSLSMLMMSFSLTSMLSNVSLMNPEL